MQEKEPARKRNFSSRKRTVEKLVAMVGPLVVLSAVLSACQANSVLSDLQQLKDASSGATQGQVGTPQFSPPGGTYGPAQAVEISTSTDGATIRYTTDGSTPTETVGSAIPSGGSVSVSSSLTLKAIAYENGLKDSAVATASYAINGQLAPPTFQPAGDATYYTPQSVTISAASGASIRYATDGSTPSETAGTVYQGTPVAISSATTLKAIAYEGGWSDSPVASASFSFAAPIAPTISSAVGGSGEVTVTWGTVSGATSYNLYWEQGSTVTTTSGTEIPNAVSGQVVGSLTNGTEYAFIVTAVGTYGESAPSPVVTATPPLQWTSEGTAGSASNSAQVYWTSLAFDSSTGTPYIAYEDLSTSNDAVSVRVWNGAGWGYVGGPGISPGWAIQPKIAIYNGIPYLAFLDMRSTTVSGVTETQRVTVEKFDSSTQSWVLVGNADFSAGSASWLSLAIASNGTPFVAYSDDYNSDKATVMMYNGSNWVSVGSAGFTPGAALDMSLAIFPGTTDPYIAFADGANGYKATVMMYNGSWQTVGNAGFSASSIPYSAANPSNMSIAFDPSTDNVYVGYVDTANGSGATVMTLSSGSTWTTVGSSGFTPGINDGYGLSMAVYDNTPYLAFRDPNNSANAASVMMYNGSTWAYVGSPGYASIGDGDGWLSLAVFNGTPYLGYADFSHNYAMVTYAH